MSSSRSWLGALALATFAVACSQGERTLAESRGVFVEDEPGGRALAQVEAKLSSDGPDGRLQATVSAVGPRVEPVPGFAGVRGSNRITARELTRILAAERLEVRTLDRANGAVHVGEQRAARRGKVPERRLAADGSLERGETREEFVLALEVGSGALAPGSYRTELVVDGRTRLAIEFSFDDSGGCIERIDCPGTTTEELGP